MAIFSRSDKPRQKSDGRVNLAARGMALDTSISIIATGMIVTGDVVTDGIVRIEGEVRGTVRAGRAVLLGPNGRVDGDIVTEEAVVGGTVAGTIVASGRLELQSTCAVFGELISRPTHLKVEEGAQFAGEVKLLDAEDPMAVLGGQPFQDGNRPSGSDDEVDVRVA